MDNFTLETSNQNQHLINAVRDGDFAAVVRFLDRGANIEAAENRFSDTVLVLAVSSGHKDIVKLLLDHGADIEDADRYGYKLLILAVRHGHQAIVELLLERGANIDAADDVGNTALISAAEFGCTNIVQLLLSHGANIESADQEDATAISCVVELFFSPYYQRCKNEYREIFKILAEHNAVIDEKTQAILDEKDLKNELKQYIGYTEHYLMK